MEETDVEVEMDAGLEEGKKVIENAKELERGLKEVFGSSALTTQVKDKGNRVSVKGDGWSFVVRGDVSLVFKPGGASYRIVRDVGDLENVEEKDDGGVSFVFTDEESITLRRGVEHRS